MDVSYPTVPCRIDGTAWWSPRGTTADLENTLYSWILLYDMRNPSQYILGYYSILQYKNVLFLKVECTGRLHMQTLQCLHDNSLKKTSYVTT